MSYDEALYTAVLTGNHIAVHLMCRRCGALVAAAIPETPQPLPTPERAHTAFHAQIDRLARRADEQDITAQYGPEEA